MLSLEEIEEILKEEFPYEINAKRDLALKILNCKWHDIYELMDLLINQKEPYDLVALEEYKKFDYRECECQENHII